MILLKQILIYQKKKPIEIGIDINRYAILIAIKENW